MRTVVPALRKGLPAVCCALVLSIAACGKAPDNPTPKQPTPKTSSALPLTQRSLPALDSLPEAKRLPAIPAENSPDGVMRRRPVRIWI